MVEESFQIVGNIGVGGLIFYALIRIERKADSIIELLHRLNGGGK